MRNSRGGAGGIYREGHIRTKYCLHRHRFWGSTRGQSKRTTSIILGRMVISSNLRGGESNWDGRRGVF